MLYYVHWSEQLRCPDDWADEWTGRGADAIGAFQANQRQAGGARADRAAGRPGSAKEGDCGETRDWPQYGDWHHARRPRSNSRDG